MALAIPLPILLVLIVGGIGGTVGVLYGLGWGVPARIADADAAIQRFLLDYPDDTVADAIVDAEGGGALLLLGCGTLGLVSVLGDRFVVRKLRPGALRSLSVEPTVLRLSLDDLTFPSAIIWLGEGAIRSPWLERLSALSSNALAS